ncbi:hypothetical protein CesoFtcFv8_005791 [Champsocephalus esox]|uniref:Pleckstrin homology domain-containing family G member 2 n=1 Tax=Champsocephalus esox TaxID=159716 RepID=A0AAN8CL88_9TELE|nr:hypothetical protein CesoFtcFv8_005791 [Champsocephalus esox]
MKTKSLVSFFQERQSTLSHSLPLETYLLKPVQRILKYHLLLQELSKHFDKSDPGYEVIEDAIITMTAVAWYINDMKRKQEHAVRLQEIEFLLVNWSGPDLGGFGELVLEGSFKVQRVKKERAFFLFDKMLLIAKKRVGQFVYSTHIFCCNLLLVETLKDSLCFKVSDQTIPKLQHVVQTKNQEEKRLWVHYLKRLIVENHPASLPMKARQVLGDNFCQTPQFDLKKSSASPRLDDPLGFHRGRRPSEPSELTYTPEKTRKGLPLLLEGNLPYRQRSRRRSAPAKDIEAAFHPSALKPAGSEGKLTGSTSSVLQLENQSTEPALRPQEEEEEDDEDMAPLCPPPTLSITEEILEFINQSRAREGLQAIHCDPPEQVLDQPKESPPPEQTNFTCPLPPVTCPSSPELIPTMQLEQQPAEMEDDAAVLQSQSEDLDEENQPGDETLTNEVQDISSEVEKDVEAGEESQVEVVEQKKEEETRTRDEEGEHKLVLSPGILPTEEHVSRCQAPTKEEESTSSSPNPNPPLQRYQLPTRSSHLTQRDKKIIEKIRSYYEAAAEAEEDELEEADGEGEGVESVRRNSFSQIPSGLVKTSVSRFDVNGHQEEVESAGSRTTEAADADMEPHSPISLVSSPSADADMEPHSPISPVSSPSADADMEPHSPISPVSSPSADAKHDGQADDPIRPLDFEAQGPASSVMPDNETPKQEDLNLESNQDVPVGEEADIQDEEEDVCKKPVEEGFDEQREDETSAVATQEQGIHSPPSTITDTRREESIKPSAGPQALVTGHTPIQEQPSGSINEAPKPLPTTETSQATETKGSTVTRTQQCDVEKTIGNLEGLPSQIKVGRWSHHSRIVSDNRVLFEGMGSDVAGIGLFEASPAVDPMLMENSERILSKVQTIARMYSAKASTMKVPLHQKRSGGAWNLSWRSNRVSGRSNQSQTESRGSQTQTQYRQQTQNQMDVNQSYDHAETKCGHQVQTKAKVQSQAESRQRSQSQTYSQNQNLIREEQTIHEERTMKTAESLTSDFQEPASAPCDPPLIGQVFEKEDRTPACQSQSNAFTLSRPRDFISALNKERDSMTQNQSDRSDAEERRNRQRSELIGGCHVFSTSEPNPSALNKPKCDMSKERDRQDAPAVQYIQDQPICTGRADDTLTKRVPSVHASPASGESSTAEPSPGPAGDQAQKETLFLAEGGSDNPGVSGGPKNDGTRMVLRGSSLVFAGEKPRYGRHPHVTFDPSQVSGHRVTETSEDHRAGAPSPWSSCQKAESNPADRLPTFTSQRPHDLPTAAGQQAASDTRYLCCRLNTMCVEI